MTERRIRPRSVAVGFGVAVIAAATALAWLVSGGQLSPAMTGARAVADLAASVCLGLALVPRLDQSRYRDELTGRAAAPLAAAAAVWLVAELARVLLLAAEISATALTRLSLPTLVDFAWSTAPGRAAVFSVVAAAAVCALALSAPRAPTTTATVAGLATAGIAARAVTGHVSDGVLTSMSVVVHSLAAALWFGTLAGLALTVSARGQWARVLPAFSRYALPTVAVLVGTGVLTALGALDSPAQLVQTGYGRVLLAKVAVTAVVLILAWAHRGGWLRAARSHRIGAQDSLRRSVVELALLTVALTLAAGLTVTG